MIVVSEDVYKNLLNQNNVLTEPLDSVIIKLNRELSQILHDSKQNNTEKYIRYEQKLKELQKALATKHENANNVAISSINPSVLKQISTSMKTQHVPSTTSPLNRAPSLSESEPIRPSSPAVTETSMPSAPTSLRKFVELNLDKLGCNDTNVLNSNKKMIRGAKWPNIVDYLSRSPLPNEVKPNGTDVLLQRIEKLRPSLLKAQKGQGLKKLPQKYMKKVKFRPQLWTRR